MERPSGPPRLRKSDFFDFPENELKLKIPQGHYECQVENSFGSASSIIRLTDKGMICSSEFFLASFFILSIFSEPANLLVTCPRPCLENSPRVTLPCYLARSPSLVFFGTAFFIFVINFRDILGFCSKKSQYRGFEII